MIAPILTRRDGLLVQSTYHPFRMLSQYAHGESLRPLVSCPTYRAGDRGEAPVLDCAASYDPTTETAAVFLVNRDLREGLEVCVGLADRQITGVVGVEVLGGGDVKAANTWERPNAVVPSRGEAFLADNVARVRVPSPGMAVLRLNTRRA